jgi:hypothetical protein
MREKRKEKGVIVFLNNHLIYIYIYIHIHIHIYIYIKNVIKLIAETKYMDKIKKKKN